MARIEINKPGPGAFIVNGVDLSMEAFVDGMELVVLGDGKNPEFDVVGLQVRLDIDTLSLGGKEVELDDLDAVNTAIRDLQMLFPPVDPDEAR